MLKLEGQSGSDPRRLSSMSPQEYLDWCKATELEYYVAHAQGTEEQAGIRIEAVQGVPVPILTDATKLKSALLSTGASEEYVALAIDRIRSGQQLKDNCRRLADMERRYQDFRSAALKLCGPYRQQLADVPVGVGANHYMNAGAAPAPAGGDIVLLNRGLDHMIVWAQFVMTQRHSAFLSSDTSRSKFLQITPELTLFARSAFGAPIPAAAHCFPSQVDRRCAENMRVLAEHLRLLMDMFIILHEFGHVARKHTDALRHWERDSILSQEELIERRAIERQFEFEADAFAMDALCGVYMDDLTERPQRPMIATAVADVFGFMALGRSTTGPAPALHSHPDPAARSECLIGVDPHYPEDAMATDLRYMNRFASLFQK